MTLDGSEKTPALPVLKRLVPLLLALLPAAAYVLYLALNSGVLFTRDYWTIFAVVLGPDGFSPRLADWFSRENEHILFFPRLIYALNFLMTGGSNIGLTLVTWFFALTQWVLLTGLLFKDLRRRPWLRNLLAFALACFVFTPSAIHNWTAGFSGVAWVGANLLVVASVVSLAAYWRAERTRFLVLALSLAALGTVTYSTPLALLPGLFLGLWLAHSRRAAVWSALAFGLAILAIYVTTYNHPENHPSFEFADIDKLIGFSLIYMGGIFAANTAVAAVLGGLGVLGFGVAAALLLGAEPATRRIMLPWSILQMYAWGTAVMAAITRSGFGLDYALQSRYATLPGLFWVSLAIALTLWAVRSGRFSRIAAAFLVVALAASITAMTLLGLQRAREYLHRATFQPLVALSLQMEIPDDALIAFTMPRQNAQHLLSRVPIARATGHVPFAPQYQVCPQEGTVIDLGKVKAAPGDVVEGALEFIDPYGEQGARAVGWAYAPRRRVKQVLLVDENGLVRGCAIAGFNRPDIAAQLGVRQADLGWLGYVRAVEGDTPVTAYVRLAGDDSLRPLAGTYSFSHPGGVNPDAYGYITGIWIDWRSGIYQ